MITENLKKELFHIELISTNSLYRHTNFVSIVFHAVSADSLFNDISRILMNINLFFFGCMCLFLSRHQVVLLCGYTHKTIENHDKYSIYIVLYSCNCVI